MGLAGERGEDGVGERVVFRIIGLGIIRQRVGGRGGVKVGIGVSCVFDQVIDQVIGGRVVKGGGRVLIGIFDHFAGQAFAVEPAVGRGIVFQRGTVQCGVNQGVNPCGVVQHGVVLIGKGDQDGGFRMIDNVDLCGGVGILGHLAIKRAQIG